MPPALEMRGITRSFAGNSVLAGVSLRAAAGEVHALVGENGAGKSTLMKILAGVHRPDGGEILIDGRPVSFSRPADALAQGVAESGAAVVMVSSDLPELLGMADRILVMRRGRLVAELDAKRTTQEAVLTHAALEEAGGS